MKEYTLQEIIELCDSEKYDYPEIFADNCGLDIVIPEKGLHAVKSWGFRDSNRVRRATLEISTFVGISFGAIHYYGDIVIQGVNMEYDEKPGTSTFIYDNNLPLALYTYKLKLKRPVTKEEIETDPDRWLWYREGSLTNCFETIEEIIELAKQVFKLRFSGSWEFYVESPYKMFNGKLEICQ